MECSRFKREGTGGPIEGEDGPRISPEDKRMIPGVPWGRQLPEIVSKSQAGFHGRKLMAGR
ncbi:MAG: hypothetical protein LAO21_00160 [Acidobacteriia bacterium]|nr:hypothetical protein [Terriglobia bacterium]